MDLLADPYAWAAATFGTVDLGDRRRTQRLIASAARIAANPNRPFPQVFDWNSLRGFYRVCDQDEATVESIQRPHWEQTRRALATQSVALIVHDTTELDFTDHPLVSGLGPIGDHRGRGFFQHNSLAVVPDNRRVLGLTYQQLWVRPAPDNPEPTLALDCADEGEVWLRGIRATGTPPPGCCWVHVGDRASDDYEAMRAALAGGQHFLWRLSQNRLVFTTPEHQQSAPLLDYARSLAGQGPDTVHIAGRGGREARSAVVQLAGAPVWIPAPSGTLQRWSQPVLAAWVIRVWEPDPPKGLEPLEWVLLCSLPTTTLAELRERRDWYSCRWLVELYHLAEKTGCGEEERRFETAERLAACLALLAVVAVRILQLRNALDWEGEAPAAQVATPREIEVVQRSVGERRRRRWTVRDFVRAVARLGGFLGRKRDGEPGMRTLWRGYQRLQDMLLGYDLHPDRSKRRRKDVGNR
jgi:hypothetical protein